MKKIILSLVISLVGLACVSAAPKNSWVEKYQKEGVYHIYNNTCGKKLTLSCFGSQANLYKKEGSGKKISWESVDPWSIIIFDYAKVEDLTELVNDDYVLEFKIKSNNRQQKLQFYFTSNVNGTSYQKGKIITEEDFTPGDEWQTVRIPLKEMESWDLYDKVTKGFLPNKFSWDNVGQFIIQNHEVKLDYAVEFMDIRITK